jgi:hypothetical protein
MSLVASILLLAAGATTAVLLLQRLSLSPLQEFLILAPTAVVLTGLLLGWEAGAVALLPVAGAYIQQRLRART